MKLAVQYPDPERTVKDYLDDVMDEDCTITVGVPTTWTSTSGDHLQVACDGTPEAVHPVIAHATVRLVGWSVSPTRAKRLATIAQGLLLAHPGGGGISSTQFLTGVQPARDNASQANLAATTTRVSLRSLPIT